MRDAVSAALERDRQIHESLKHRSAEFAAYWWNQPRSIDEINMLCNGGIWRAYTAPKPLSIAVPDVQVIEEALEIYEFKARHIGDEKYEIYAVSTGEVVGRIN